MPLETLLSPPFFGVAGSLSFSNTLRVASHKTMEAPKGAVCPKCGTPITKMEHSLDDPQEFEYYCPRCRKWYHYVEFQLQQYQEVSGFTLKGEKLFHLEDAVFLLWIFGVTVIPFLTWLLRNNRILIYLPITCELLLLCFAVWFFYGRERRKENG